MSLIIFRQICQFRFSIKTLVLIMILLAFVLSVINNHFLLIQVNKFLYFVSLIELFYKIDIKKRENKYSNNKF
jgi:hypothetical protein